MSDAGDSCAIDLMFGFSWVLIEMGKGSVF